MHINNWRFDRPACPIKRSNESASVNLTTVSWQGLESRNITYSDELDFDVTELDTIYNKHSPDDE